MVQYSNQDAEVCVIGRTNFRTGIGCVTYGFAELLSRSFPTCIQPTDGGGRESVTLPNGRVVPVWNGSYVKASIFVDVLWNGTYDCNYHAVPGHGLRLAVLVWDSDELPAEWIDILNNCFDGVVCLSPHLEEVARSNGVKTPCVCIPLPLDLAPMLSRPLKQIGSKIRIGCVAAFHPRKNTRMLIDAFIEAFREQDDVELIVHSNVAFPETIADVRHYIDDIDASNVTISTDNLTEDEKSRLIDSFDVFVNLSQGEGYSIGPREALALGKTLVLSNVGGHQELAGLQGVFMVEPELKLPARFPEIDNRVFGEQSSVRRGPVAEALVQAVKYVGTPLCREEAHVRRMRAADFGFEKLTQSVASLLNADILKFRKSSAPPEVSVSKDYTVVAAGRLASLGGLTTRNARVVAMHDGGFFSIFNTFFSHLVWDLKDDRCHRVLPDWDVSRFLERQNGQNILSFCYGKPKDGNIWTKLYKPLFGMTEAEMQSEEELYRRASPPRQLHNEDREPLLTYIHAARLYEQKWFPQLRREYANVYADHIRLEDRLQKEIDDFIEQNMSGYTVLGAHVRHPSHTVEQPNALIAHADEYIENLRLLASKKGLHANSDNWRIFLATDQESVITRFQKAFGDRLIFWKEARRTTCKEDAVFDALTNKNVDGYQLQHLVAKNRSAWSVDMAREVIRDAYLMASCDSLFHVVSNVSTAVSYINPNCELIFFAK